MQDLQTLTTPKLVSQTPSSSALSFEIPEGWQQGRGAFGGLVLAGMVRAIEQAYPNAGSPQKEPTPDRSASLLVASPPRFNRSAGEIENAARWSGEGSRPRFTLRSLTAVLCGPVQPGEASISVEPLRIGSGVSTYAVRLVQSNEVQTHAVITLGRRRVEDGDWCHIAPPEMPNWREMEPIPIGPPLAPQFAQFFDFRTRGPFPFSGSKDAATAGWIRPKDPGAARDDAYLVALADAWWPSALTRFEAPRPMATLSFTFEAVGSLDGVDPDAPLFHTARAEVARDGYTSEDRLLFTEDRRLVALNRQTFVIIR